MIQQLARIDSDLLVQNQNAFRELSRAYASFAARAGVEVIPFLDSELPLFSALDPYRQAEILNALGVCVKICERAQFEGSRGDQSPSLVWSALKEFKLRPPSDFFGYIQPDSVIEIHSPMGIQLFRNFNFYQYCSYTIEELYSQDWNTLFTRNGEIVVQMLDFVKKIYTGQVTHTVAPGIPAYTAEETTSRKRYQIKVEWVWGAPLFEEGTSVPMATIAIEKAQLLRAHTAPGLARTGRPPEESARLL